MKTTLHLTVAAVVFAAFNLSAATLHVSLDSPNPSPPYTNWATAATNIQDAVDAAKDGDTVLVTNGVYATGARDVLVLDTNLQPPQWVSAGLSRVVVTNSTRLESANGPGMTTIKGICLTNEYGHVTNGIRCVFLGSNAVLSGFTLANGGLTVNDTGEPGAWGDHLEAKGAGIYASSTNAMVTNCVLAGNRTTPSEWSLGGGVFSGILHNCVLTNNVGANGGGAYGSVLYRCSVDGNLAFGIEAPGGGVSRSTLYDCTLRGNSAPDWGGGGAVGSTLYNCNLKGNSALVGGGVAGCILYNCTLTDNSALWPDGTGGGACDSYLYNCTLSGNSGGGASSSTLINCIAYFNTAASGANHVQCTLDYCCTTPLPTNGIGNTDANPRFVNAAAGDFRLRPDSPCIDAGTNFSDIITTDITGEFRPWDGNKDGVAAFDMGAYEFRPSPVTLYVSLQSTDPTPPFVSWATAATNIQDAVDVAKDGDTVLVTNGVYAVGERDMSVLNTNTEPPQLESVGLSRVVVTNSIRLESVNGPLATAIDGNQTVRCVFLGTDAVLGGFAVTNGRIGGRWGRPPPAPAFSGGGVYAHNSSVITNCSISGCRASGAVGPAHIIGSGGGVAGGLLYNCTLSSNEAATYGGGACGSSLHNCTVIDNFVSMGGGAYGCTLYNCVLSNNSAGSYGGGTCESTLYDCTLIGNSVGGFGGGACESILYNCTLKGNASAFQGGGAWNGTLYNCTVTGNSANNIEISATGGGASYATLINCVLNGNSATWGGGGACESTLYNCTVVGNWAQSEGGGAALGTLHNCIVYYNTAPYGADCSWSTLNYCCTTPLPTNGVGNITGPPLFMDLAAGDLRLWEASACIDAGKNLLDFPMRGWISDLAEWGIVGYVTEPTDILGNTRFIDGNGDGIVGWDIGAYEFNSFKPPRFIGSPERTAEGWRLNVTGEPNKWTRVERSSNMRDWGDMWSGFMPADGLKQITDTETNQMMFYRAVVP